MIPARAWLPLALVLCIPVLWAGSPDGVFAAESESDIPAGRLFTQAGNYSVIDDEGARFWGEFQRLGGVARLGYPVSTRFVYKGFTTQVFQKVALQWRPEEGRAFFVNVFDELTASGKDDWLLTVSATDQPVPCRGGSAPGEDPSVPGEGRPEPRGLLRGQPRGSVPGR